MNVRELVDILNTYDPNTEVYFSCYLPNIEDIESGRVMPFIDQIGKCDIRMVRNQEIKEFGLKEGSIIIT